MTGGQAAATTPEGSLTTTTPLGNPERPFNLPLLAYAAGASYVARWTMLHIQDLTESIKEAMVKPGFAFIEALSPCPVNYGRRNKEKPLDTLTMYRDKTIIKNGASPLELDVDSRKSIILGKFVDIQKPTFFELYEKIYRLAE